MTRSTSTTPGTLSGTIESNISSSSIKIRMQTQTHVCFIPLNDDESPSSNDPAEFY